MPSTSLMPLSKLFLANLLYLTGVSVLAVVTRHVADRNWFGAINLYLPQFIWVVPGLLLIVITLIAVRKWVWMPLMGLAIVVGPLMGLSMNARVGGHTSGNLLRVMTWNIKYGTHDRLSPLAITYDIDRNKPDVVLLQDARNLLDGPIGECFKSWNVRSFGQYIIASRFPISELQVKPISFPGENHTCVRATLQIGTTTVAIYNVHFLTPRSALKSLRPAMVNPLHVAQAIRQLQGNVEQRLIQARALRAYLDQERGPVIVAGDLNSPITSYVCSMLNDAGFKDSFSAAGSGYGYTYGHFLLKRKMPFMNLSWMRIDHILASPHLLPLRCWTGTDGASDHRPVIADLALLYK